MKLMFYLIGLLAYFFPSVATKDKTHAQEATDAHLNGSCRYLPGDPDWPNLEKWTQLNTSVSGRLIQTVPLASVCHGSLYNENECLVLKDTWNTTIPQ